MKALALLRMGRMEESKALVDGVIETRPGDSATLQAVVMYCRELGDCKFDNKLHIIVDYLSYHQ